MAVNNLNTGVGIQPTIVDAKGDLIAATANDAVNRLAVGTNGHVLVADSDETTGLKWNDPGSVGGLVHIETQTDSGVAAINFNDVFTSAFRNYLILGNASSITSLRFRLRLANSNIVTTNYNFHNQQSFTNANTYAAANGGAGSSFYTLTAPSAGLRTFFRLEVSAPALASQTTFLGQSMTPQAVATAGGVNFGFENNALARDGFSIITASGNFSGTISVYGYKE